jgi:NAD(P)-dependent dehydrogenase (short-subunit alcohol dehydrogenase family)
MSKSVLITGASRGLGAATARAAAELGANVALAARSKEDLKRVAQQISEAGSQALVLEGDVTLAADCQRWVSRTVEEFGTLDALINNAGVISPVAPIAEADPQSWQRNWAINVQGPFMLTQAALPHLRQSQGCVINISSGAATMIIQGWGAYCTSKAGVAHFTRLLAAEEPKVTALAVRPGIVDTDMQATIRREGSAGMPAEDYARFVRYHEEGELLPPEVPGCALAVLAFHAPSEWSGASLSWNQEDVLSLVRQYGCTTNG